LSNSAPNLAALAREVAMDILPMKDILELHKLTDEEWELIRRDRRFDAMLTSMIRDWNSADNTRERVRVKAATGFEALMEPLIQDAKDPSIPLVQRTEVLKLLVRIGELENDKNGIAGGAFNIQINVGALPAEQVTVTVPASLPDLKLIDG